jgi:hypothetical protein
MTRMFSSLQHPDGSGGHPAFYIIGIWGYFLGGIAVEGYEVGHSLQFGVWVKMVDLYVHSPHMPSWDNAA